MSSLAARSVLRSAARSVQRSRAPLSSSTLLARKPTDFHQNSFPQVTARRAFSATMAAKSGAPPSNAPQTFDPEIVETAKYVHNYKIDSELAVWRNVVL